MRKISLLALAALFSTFLLSCEAAGTVFQAGKWWGIIIAVVVLGLVFLLFGRRKN